MTSVNRQLELIEQGHATGSCDECLAPARCGKREPDSMGRVYVHGCFRAGSERHYTNERAQVIEAPERSKI